MPPARRGALHVPLLTQGACRRAQTGGADEFGVRLTVLCHEIIILRHCFFSSSSDIRLLNKRLLHIHFQTKTDLFVDYHTGHHSIC